MENKLRVLVVEDSVSQATVIAGLVEKLGLVPVVYNSLPGGITQILVAEEPRLVLLDLRLLDAKGNMIADGFQICREIKRLQPELPVIVVTAEGDDDACEWALRQGADGFLQKPFAEEDLTSVIYDVLEEE